MKNNPLLNSLLSRRETLKLMGAAGAASFFGLGEKNVPFLFNNNAPYPHLPSGLLSNLVGPSLYSVSPLRFTKDLSEVSCVARPALTEGPYFVDEKLNRSDLRTDPATNAVSTGIPLKLTINVTRASGSTCTPLVGAYVDIWHCDVAGTYSDIANGAGQANTSGKKYLRGYQVTDSNGAVTFTTIYPGWYSGRTVHIHYKIRLFAGSAKTYEFTSQLFFDDSLTDQVYTQAPYSSRANRNTRNSNDSIYQSGGSAVLLSVTADGSGGYQSSFDVALSGVPTTSVSSVTAVSGATFIPGGPVSSEGIASIFGADLADSSQAAPSVPLPTTLAGTSVTVKDASGTSRTAPLYYASPTQLNIQIPAGTGNGPSTITVIRGDTTYAQGTVPVETVAPGIFSVSADGSGIASALIQRVKIDGSQSWEAVAQYDATQKKYVAIPIDLSNSTDQVYLVVFGTGFRNRTMLGSVDCTIDGVSTAVSYAGPQGYYIGVDQANALIPSSLAGRRTVNVILRVDAKQSNAVTINIK